MNELIQAFDFNEHAVRVMLRESQPWFVAADVCRVLEIANSRDALRGLDEDEKGVGSADTLGGPQNLNLISESGLYALIFKSRKPEARKFRKWVTAEVLPALRQTGAYGQPVASVVTLGLRDLRELLIRSAREVLDRKLDVGRAQQVANTAARYLETLKLEGDACGYQILFNLPAAQAAGGILPRGDERPGDGRVQGLLERGLPGEEAGEAGVQGAPSGREGPLAEGERGPLPHAQPEVPGTADL